MLLVIGLDGATLDLAAPWMDAGRLPTLARLRARSLWGPLRSTVPPATLPSWTTFMTGVNPGRHGIFDFTRRESGTYGVRFVNSTYRKMPTIWRLLSDAGQRVAVLGMPGTYPPEPVNGCMISGFDAPVTTRANRSFVFPAALADDVMRLGGFSFADFQEFYVGPGWYPMALSRLLRGIAAKTELARALLMREPWDVFALVFGETDTVAHHFWHFHDARSPRHDAAGAAAHGDAIERVYAAIDTALGELLARVPEATVVIASDHGFGGAGDKAVFLNRWLASSGWLRFAATPSSGVAGLAKRAALRGLPSRWQGSLFRSFNGRIADRMESRARFGGIDWTQTLAFSEELNYFPNIWINRRGVDPQGQVDDESYARVCAEITAALRAWRDPESGDPVVRRVWHRAEIYDGPHVEGAPDLLLELAEVEGYSYTCLPSHGRPGEAVQRLSRAELVGGKRFGTSGSHRAEGMFMVAADDRKADFKPANILDMAPTLLRLCGVAPPAWMEGTALVGGGHRPQNASDGIAATTEEPYAPHEERAVEERLRALGYIE